VPHAPPGYGYLEVLVCVHVAHGYERAVFGPEGRLAMSAAYDAHFVGDFGNQITKSDISGIRVRHVLDEVRKLIARIDALKARRTVNVVFAVH